MKTSLLLLPPSVNEVFTLERGLGGGTGPGRAVREEGQLALTHKSAWLAVRGLRVIRAQEMVAFTVLLKNVNFLSAVGQ